MYCAFDHCVFGHQMEKQAPPTLAARVKKIIIEAEEPPRAIDIVKKLAELEPPVTVTATDVNKVLYALVAGVATFEKATDKGKPTWRVKPASVVHPRPESMHTFAVSGVAYVSIPTGLSASSVETLLRTLHQIGESSHLPREFRCEATPAGEALATVAQSVGFKLGKSLGERLE
jgi:hypothetical protein